MSAAASAPRAGHLGLDVGAGGIVLATGAAALLGAGPVVTLAPLGVAAGVLALRRAPLRPLALGLLLAVLAIDNPQEIPATGRWKSPFSGMGTLLFENLNKTTGIEALRFSLLDVTLMVLAAAAWLRHARAAPTSVALRDLCVLAALGLLGIELWGLLTGGDFRNSLWQVQQPLAAPLLALLLSRLLDLRRDRIALGLVILAAAAVKAALGLYVYLAVFRPLGEKPQYTTTHSDSVLFTVAVVLLAGFAATRRTWGALALAGTALPVLAVAIALNNRRLAWVEIGASALVFYVLLPRERLKQALTRWALASVPILALYGAVGWSSSSALFRPVQLARSLGDSDLDRSTATRDIENYNLIQTLKTNPLLGTGFGHEYHEVSRADDISAYFAQYRFIPHNSLLGLWAFGGLLGFSLVWLPVAAGLYLAARSYRAAVASLDRTAALAIMAALVAYTIQCWGDMGFQSWPASFLLATALAAAGQLAVTVGAWPAPRLEIS